MLFIGSIAQEKDFPTGDELLSPTVKLQYRLFSTLKSLGVSHVLSLAPWRQFHRSGRFFLPYKRSRIDKVHLSYLGMINIEPIKSLNAGFFLFIWILCFHQRRESIFVYNQGLTHQTMPWIICAAWCKQSSVIACITDVDSADLNSSFVRKLIYKMQKWSIARVSRVIALHETVRNLIRPHTPFYLLQGFSVDQDFAQELSQLPLSKNHDNHDAPIRLLYTGSLNRVRGIRLLLDAFSLLEQDKFTLTIMGRGDESGYVSAYCDSRANCEFAGFVSDAERIAVIEKSDILVNPHLVKDHEATYLYPSKLAEYFLSGRPVVSTSHGINDAMKAFTFISEEDSAEGLAKAISQAAKEKTNWAEMVSRSRKYIQTEKSWEVIGHELRKFIQMDES